jgi:hypothetical protein
MEQFLFSYIMRTAAVAFCLALGLVVCCLAENEFQSSESEYAADDEVNSILDDFKVIR